MIQDRLDMPSTIDASCAGAAARGRAHAPAAVCAMGVIAFALLTALGAQIRVPLPGTPVPMTLQTLAVLLSGLTLGPWLGSASMLLYLLLGMTGVPVFADAVWTDGVLLGATGGYLVGFVLCQPVLGLIASARLNKSVWPTAVLAAVFGNMVIFGCGLIWLSASLGTDLSQTLAKGLWPFMIGMVLKTGVAAGLGSVCAPVARWLQGKT